MPQTKSTKKPAATTAKKSGGITAGERAAVRELVRERKANLTKEEAETRGAREDRRDAEVGSRHGRAAPCARQGQRAGLASRTWYGMPAYTKDGKVVCFFKSANKFKSRYATFGFEEAANLDDGAMWPTSYALTALTAADEKKIVALVKKAVR